jgi:hypothetical protein
MLDAHVEEDLHQLLGDLGKDLGKRRPSAAIYLKELKQMNQLSLGADPFVRYEGKRVKARGVHNPMGTGRSRAASLSATGDLSWAVGAGVYCNGPAHRAAIVALSGAAFRSNSGRALLGPRTRAGRQ